MLAIWPGSAVLVSWLFGSQVPISTPPSPSFCLQDSRTLEQLVSCLDNFTVPHNYYDQLTYQMAQPTDTQRAGWADTITSLLSVDGNCSAVVLPDSLQGLYMVTSFHEQAGSSYCILAESNVSLCQGAYVKGWGYMVVPATRATVSRSIHFSAPHPKYDLNTVQQAASLFRSTGAHSLLVAGRIRTAFLHSSGCIIPTGPGQPYYMTDPAHNNLEPFFDANKAIHTWQTARGGCPSSSCAFVQFHGKGRSTCSLDQMFISTGLGNTPLSKEWYTDEIDRPVKRLKSNLQAAFPAWNISLPSDSQCLLTATKNVVGRYINSVNLSDVCKRAARVPSVSGDFVHVEQADIARKQESYGGWSKALKDTFDTTCVDGMLADPLTQLCAILPKKSLRLGVKSAGGAVPKDIIAPNLLNRSFLLNFLMSLLDPI